MPKSHGGRIASLRRDSRAGRSGPDAPTDKTPHWPASDAAPLRPEPFDRIPPDQDGASLTADAACDTRQCHDALAACGAAAIIPPRGNAKP